MFNGNRENSERFNRLMSVAADAICAELESEGDDEAVWNLIEVSVTDDELPEILSAVVWLAAEMARLIDDPIASVREALRQILTGEA